MGAAAETKPNAHPGGKAREEALGTPLSKRCDREGKMADALIFANALTLNFWSPFWKRRLTMSGS